MYILLYIGVYTGMQWIYVCGPALGLWLDVIFYLKVSIFQNITIWLIHQFQIIQNNVTSDFSGEV